MGMLFNSAATLDILKQLNKYYGAGNINSIRGTAANYQLWPLLAGTYDFVTHLPTPLVPTATGLDGLPAAPAWKKFLHFLDTHPNQKKRGGEFCATTVGNAIYEALNNINCLAIEFFAVPDASNTKHISVDTFDPVDIKKHTTKTITVYTVPYDKLLP
jgi:hypothetical protein